MKLSLYTGQIKSKGKLINAYQPLKNLIDENRNLSDFTTDKLNFDMEHPVDILIQDAYDGAVNLLLNDDKNPPRLINSRFSVQNDSEYLIPDHYGFKDSNVYDSKTFDVDTRLKAIYNSIPTLKFDGISNNTGKLPVGSYSFYFKLADVDGNETEVCQESGVVQLHIGEVNDSNTARMGLEDESSNKSVSFILSNIDAGFDYVHVLYARSSSGSDQAAVTTYSKVLYDYPVYKGTCVINITGNESIVGTSAEEFYTDLADINSVKTQAIHQDLLLFGNVSKAEHDWPALKAMSWKIIPTIYQPTDDVGSLNVVNYQDHIYEGYEKSTNYYNVKNVYNSVGYWPDEVYRFGIVYVFDDNSLSPVFNIQGCDLDEYKEDSQWYKKFFNTDGYQHEYQPGNSENESDDLSSIQENDSYFFNKEGRFNSKGVIHFPKRNAYELKNGQLISKPLGIKFDFSYINLKQIQTDTYGTEKFIPVVGDKSNTNSWKDIQAIFKKHHIMGFFFVRQKRVPTILGQGMIVGLTDRYHGSIPVLQRGLKYIAQSFLAPDRSLRSRGTFVNISNSNVSNNAMIMPDAELSEATFNQLFCSNDYWLERVGNCKVTASNNDQQLLTTSLVPDEAHLGGVVKLTNVPEDLATITDGTNYFATRVGNESEPYKTADVEHAWRWTLPQDLTESTTLIRGNWGAFVGLSDNPFTCYDIVNIKKENFQYPEALTQHFKSQFNNLNAYHSISHRINVSDLVNNSITCFRGDCFTTFFTHRMFRNFIDPELPTNHQIVDPSCWRANYGVRCTSEILLSAHNNLIKDSQGWYLEDPTKKTVDWGTFAALICTGSIIGAFISLKNLGMNEDKIKKLSGLDLNNEQDIPLTPTPEEDFGDLEDDEIQYKNSLPDWVKKYYPNGMSNEIVKAFEVHVNKTDRGRALKKKLNPKEQESSGGFNLKAIFKADDAWELHGLSSINRADVNAVALGQWITLPICSNKNISFRDEDFSNATEQASFNKRRSFYPLTKFNPFSPQRDSNVINQAASISIPDKNYILFPDVPFLKQEYFTRIFTSLRDSADSITNEFKEILERAYRDYSKECGSIQKLVATPQFVLVVYSHGLGVLTIQNGQSVYEYLPINLQMITKDYGSIWKDSILATEHFVYGVDSVAKKIWRVDFQGQFTILSDHKLNKFLNDNLDMSEFTTSPYIGHINIKTHYNNFKHDIIFTYYNDSPIDKQGHVIKLMGNNRLLKSELDQGSQVPTPEEIRNSINKWIDGTHWSLCYNEDSQMFTTFYDWIPVESANIDNIWFTFDRDDVNKELPESDIIIPKLGQINPIKRNKHEIDESFTHQTLIYKTTSKISVIIRDSEVCTYYIKVPTGYNINEKSLDPNTWYFVIQPYSDTNGLIVIDPGVEYEICELRKQQCSDIKVTQVIKPEGLDYYSLRDCLHNIKLWKHGYGGVYDNQGKIKPTHWYGKQHEFNFEFCVNKSSIIQKIFNNLKIISNKTEPAKFEFEVVGEGYEWYEYKQVLGWIYKQEDIDAAYKEVLGKTLGELKALHSDFPNLFNRNDQYIIKKLPFLKVVKEEIPGLHYAERLEPITQKGKDQTDTIPHLRTLDTKENKYTENSSETMLVYDERLNEYRIRADQLGNNIKKFGRLRGNMEYLEDLWNIEIRPISFKWIYLKDGELKYSKQVETRLRDKVCKVKVRYSGEDLVVIQAIQTLFDYSLA